MSNCASPCIPSFYSVIAANLILLRPTDLTVLVVDFLDLTEVELGHKNSSESVSEVRQVPHRLYRITLRTQSRV